MFEFFDVLGDETFRLEIQDDGAIPQTRKAPSLMFYFRFFFYEVTQIKFQVVQLKSISAVQLMNLSLEVIHQDQR